MNVERLGFGVAGALDLSVVRLLAAAVEAAGFRTFWVNDTEEGDSLAALAAAADVTTTVGLATGVIPLDRQNATTILARVAELHLPEDRLTLGVGSGRAANALDLIENEVRQLKAQSRASVVVGALGPKMRALATTTSDGLLFNMLTVDGARTAVEEMHIVARHQDRAPVRTALYVRTSVGEAAERRLVLEAERYERFPNYAANFARLGARAVDTAVVAASAADVPKGLAPYLDIVDETVVRAITANDGTEEYQVLIDAVTETRSHRST